MALKILGRCLLQTFTLVTLWAFAFIESEAAVLTTEVTATLEVIVPCPTPLCTTVEVFEPFVGSQVISDEVEYQGQLGWIDDYKDRNIAHTMDLSLDITTSGFDLYMDAFTVNGNIQNGYWWNRWFRIDIVGLISDSTELLSGLTLTSGGVVLGNCRSPCEGVVEYGADENSAYVVMDALWVNYDNNNHLASFEFRFGVEPTIVPIPDFSLGVIALTFLFTGVLKYGHYRRPEDVYMDRTFV